ncbi:hypothetical protein HMPREF9162_0341 [Selenomonas sp. oral taxon 137 str. F0430]|nr:hypothetical protein HMPREF9162_0341 [Selenomonas sp. oral taxon 137 str. F0430]
MTRPMRMMHRRHARMCAPPVWAEHLFAHCGCRTRLRRAHSAASRSPISSSVR